MYIQFFIDSYKSEHRFQIAFFKRFLKITFRTFPSMTDNLVVIVKFGNCSNIKLEMLNFLGMSSSRKAMKNVSSLKP